MKLPPPPPLLPVLLALLVIWTLPSASARLGEPEKAVESRLSSSKTGIAYRKEDIQDKLNRSELPYHWLLQYFPENAVHAFYYKRTDGKSATSSDVRRNDKNEIPFPQGWDLHVVYFRGYAVLECYRRNDRPINAAELAGLLELNKGNSEWIPVAKDQRQPTLLDYTHALENDMARARHTGRFFIVYLTRFEEQLIEARKLTESQRKEEAEKELPLSLGGF